MSNKIVRGFGGNNANTRIPRSVNMAERAGRHVDKYEGPVACTVMFDNVKIAFHGEDEPGIAHRPYLDFSGKVSRIKPCEGEEFPGHVSEVLFGEVDAPVLNGRWELTNEELGELAAKGLFGGDAQVIPQGLRPTAEDRENPFSPPAPVREGMQVPGILTEVAFVDIPINMKMQVMSVDVNGRDVPVVVSTPIGTTGEKDGVIMSSPASGYSNLAAYFEPIKLYEHGGPDARARAFVQVEDWLHEGMDDKTLDEAIHTADRSPIRAEKTLTPVEQAADLELGDMKHRVDELVDQDNAGVAAERAAVHEAAAAEKAEELARIAAEEAARHAAEEAAQAAQKPAETGSGYEQGDDSSRYLTPPEEPQSGSDDPFSDKDDEERRRDAGYDAAQEQQEQLSAEEKIQQAKERGERVGDTAGEPVRDHEGLGE